MPHTGHSTKARCLSSLLARCDIERRRVRACPQRARMPARVRRSRDAHPSRALAHARAPWHFPRDVSSRHVSCLASTLRPHLAKPLSIPVHLTAQTSPSQDLSHTPTPYGYGVWEILTSRHTPVILDMPSGRTGSARARVGLAYPQVRRMISTPDRTSHTRSDLRCLLFRFC
jgi:hypothetical protein